MREHLESARTKGASNVPSVLKGREEARAYYVVLKERLIEHLPDEDKLATVATLIENIITRHKVSDWQHNPDAQNRMLNNIDDLFHDLRKETGVRIPYSDLDEVVGKIMNIAKVRDASLDRSTGFATVVAWKSRRIHWPAR